MHTNITPTHEDSTANWGSLYRLGGLGALMMVIIIIVQFVVFMVAPPPLEGGAMDWFAFFQEDGLLGLIGFELLLVVSMIVSVPVILALYIALRPVNQAFSALYLALGLIGVMAFIASRPALEMLSLSNAYAAAGSEAQKAVFIAAGESLIAIFHGTSFHVSYLLGSVTGLIISLVMLRTNIFGKTTAYLRIASSVFDFGLYVPGIGMYISIFSVLFLLVWNLLIARRLFLLARAS